jgi:hypothetical protein
VKTTAQGMIQFKKAAVDYEKSEVDIECQNISLRLTINQFDRTQHQEQYESSLASISQQFDLWVKTCQVQHKLTKHITQGI